MLYLVDLGHHVWGFKSHELARAFLRETFPTRAEMRRECWAGMIADADWPLIEKPKTGPCDHLP